MGDGPAAALSIGRYMKPADRSFRKLKFITLILAFLIPMAAAAQISAEEAIEVISAPEPGECSLPTPESRNPKPETPTPYRFQATDIIAPGVMIGLGIAGLEWSVLKHANQSVEDALWNGRKSQIRVDDYIQALPTVATYGLNLCGVKGLHDYVDLTIITGTAFLLTETVLFPTKDFIREKRPNSNRFNSFPSGHTARAFAGAEIMRREFWHVSPWIGVSGYLAATATGFMRLYNGAHWLTDVIAGAGLGIICAEAAYWLYPAITKTLFPKRYNANIFLSPVASTSSMGMALSVTF